MTHVTRFTCLALFCFLLAACGQNGPLTLPDQSPSTQQNTPAEAVPDAAQDGEPVPDVIPQEIPDPAEVPDDESI